MSDRKDSYFMQLVDEAFFDACFDDLEAADRLLAVDIGFTGITSGVVVTQHAAPPDLTVDITAGVSYDQAGRRCEITSGVNGFNCAVDENGASTAVAAPGNERWISIQLRFDRTLADLQVDGNGANVWVDQDESYSLNVVMAGEFALGTNTKPALPADGRLVCDIKLINAQTQILNADIYTDRRQDFSIFSAATIPVTSGAWTFLNPATDDVQAVFDFIDTYSITTNATREATMNIVPSAAARHLGATGKEWDLYVLELVTVAASRVDGNLLPKASSNDLGSAALRWSLYTDFLDASGDIKTGAGTAVDGHWLPKAAGNNLGAAGSEWDLYVLELVTVAASRVDGNWIPKADGNDLGSATLRWQAFVTSVTSYSSMGSFLAFSAAQTVTMYTNIVDFVSVGGTDWAWNSTVAYLQCTVGAKVCYIYFTLPHNAELDQMRIRWEQSVAATMTAEIEWIDLDNAVGGSLGGPTTIGAFGAARWDTIASAIGHTVNRGAACYRIKVTSGANTNKVYKLETKYKVTGLDKPITSVSAP